MTYALVVVDGLAVRAGPGTTYPLVAGYRGYDWEPSGVVRVTDAVRLAAGDYVFVVDGPLMIRGVPWYHVGASPGPDSPTQDPVRFSAAGDPWNAAWVAGGDGSSEYIVAALPPVERPAGPPEPYAVLNGSGDGASNRFTLGGAPVEVTWYASDPEGESCAMTVTLMPVDIDLGSARVEGWTSGGAQWAQPADTPPGPHWIEVRSDCSWSLRAHVVMG